MKRNIKLVLYSFLLVFISLCGIIKVNAASANISVSSNTNKIVVGNTFTVNVKISSGTALGSWEWIIDYDSKRFKLVSGESTVADVYQNANTKSKTYTYKFKAIGSGSGKISVRSAGAIDISENSMSLSIGSKTITVITQAELEASYSKNNNLSSLSVEGFNLTPGFDKNTTEYSVVVPSNTEKVKVFATAEDKKTSIAGAGEISVIEGDNKVQVVATAENGSTKTYIITITVKDENPINVTINNKNLTVVKRNSLLSPPTNYEVKEITINDIKVPAFYSKVNNYYLVGLKDDKGTINLYIYNEKDNTYTQYKETTLNQLLFQPLPMDKTFEDYEKSKITINDNEFESYTLKGSDYHIIHAKELNTGKDNYYLYDTNSKTAIIYTDEQTEIYKEANTKYLQIIMLLGAETVIVFLVLLIIILVSIIKKSKRKKLKKEHQKKELENRKEVKNKNDDKTIKENIETKDETTNENTKEENKKESKKIEKNKKKEEKHNEKKTNN